MQASQLRLLVSISQVQSGSSDRGSFARVNHELQSNHLAIPESIIIELLGRLSSPTEKKLGRLVKSSFFVP